MPDVLIEAISTTTLLINSIDIPFTSPKTKDIQRMEAVTPDFCACGNALSYVYTLALPKANIRKFVCHSKDCCWQAPLWAMLEDPPTAKLAEVVRPAVFLQFDTDIMTIPVTSLCVATELCSSITEARKEIQQLRLYVDGQQIKEPKQELTFNYKFRNQTELRIGKARKKSTK